MQNPPEHLLLEGAVLGPQASWLAVEGISALWNTRLCPTPLQEKEGVLRELPGLWGRPHHWCLLPRPGTPRLPSVVINNYRYGKETVRGAAESSPCPPIHRPRLYGWAPLGDKRTWTEASRGTKPWTVPKGHRKPPGRHIWQVPTRADAVGGCPPPFEARPGKLPRRE